MLSKWYIQQIIEWKILIVSKFDAEGKNLPNAKLMQNLGQNLKFLLYSNCLQHLSRINWELIIPLYAEFYDAELNSAQILHAAELSPSGSGSFSENYAWHASWPPTVIGQDVDHDWRSDTSRFTWQSKVKLTELDKCPKTQNWIANWILAIFTWSRVHWKAMNYSFQTNLGMPKLRKNW